eukprot:CAMPEP_0182419942 /NCGR_PEP_ID=MMETSP1167-20130531/4327_1 /TAXON_ID=2988 /ORGANISM="Mallomonas Sp, Strain CCMP3275" /LENGTH=581 /DNA_ID=CAMNT_0024595177 /DNA_START=97 /DNA_END=1842 /DNA_ORIENTATION=-
MKMHIMRYHVLPLIVLFLIGFAEGCTNLLVTRGASEDGSNIIAYNADSPLLYGSLYHYPKKDYHLSSMRKTYDWDSGVYLGEIQEVSHTYNVVGNINEFGLIIGETTFGGLAPLQHQDGAKVDYGSLIWLTLQRSKTARDAIKTMNELVTNYGYYSGGESFSIADNDEMWILEMIGKGNYEKGAVWVAVRLPDGVIASHANQARIRQFPQNDPENCLFSHDVVSFARSVKLYDGSDEDFSFSDTYDPLTFIGVRYGEARVWSLFGAIMGEEWMAKHQSYAEAKDLSSRMPLYVTPPKKLSLADVSALMRNHYEGTSLDMSGSVFKDVGAAFANIPYRARPMTWMSGDKEYFNERSVSIQQTGWNFIAQSRAHVPTPISGLLWFGVDDSGTTVRFPVYGCATEVSSAYAGSGAQDGVTPPMMTFNMKTAFYAFNVVANFAYSRWGAIYPDLLAHITTYEKKLSELVKKVEMRAISLMETDGESAVVSLVTDFSKAQGDELVMYWNTVFGELFVKYRDGYKITANTNQRSCGCTADNLGYTSEWYDEIAQCTGDHYLVPANGHSTTVGEAQWRSIKTDIMNRY